MKFSRMKQKKKITIAKTFPALFRNKKASKLKVVPSNYQHVGARDEQEDSFAFSNLHDEQIVSANGILVALADGMGGLDEGKEASQKAVSSFLKEYEFNNNIKTINRRLKQALSVANAAVFDLAYENGNDCELGTTLVAVVVYNDQLFWLSVGDSRAYLFRDGYLQQLTTDHIYAKHLEEDVNKGLISGKYAEEHPQRNDLTSYLGLPQLMQIDQNSKPIPLVAGDRTMLCSDGLYNTLSEEEIIAVLKIEQDDLAKELVNSALAKNYPYQDNITVAVLSFY